jgi:hypothetical protein
LRQNPTNLSDLDRARAALVARSVLSSNHETDRGGSYYSDRSECGPWQEMQPNHGGEHDCDQREQTLHEQLPKDPDAFVSNRESVQRIERRGQAHRSSVRRVGMRKP